MDDHTKQILETVISYLALAILRNASVPITPRHVAHFLGPVASASSFRFKSAHAQLRSVLPKTLFLGFCFLTSLMGLNMFRWDFLFVFLVIQMPVISTTPHLGSGPHIADVNILLPPKMTYPVEYLLQGSGGCFKWYLHFPRPISLCLVAKNNLEFSFCIL